MQIVSMALQRKTPLGGIRWQLSRSQGRSRSKGRTLRGSRGSLRPPPPALPHLFRNNAVKDKRQPFRCFFSFLSFFLSFFSSISISSFEKRTRAEGGLLFVCVFLVFNGHNGKGQTAFFRRKKEFFLRRQSGRKRPETCAQMLRRWFNFISFFFGLWLFFLLFRFVWPCCFVFMMTARSNKKNVGPQLLLGAARARNKKSREHQQKKQKDNVLVSASAIFVPAARFLYGRIWLAVTLTRPIKIETTPSIKRRRRTMISHQLCVCVCVWNFFISAARIRLFIGFHIEDSRVVICINPVKPGKDAVQWQEGVRKSKANQKLVLFCSDFLSQIQGDFPFEYQPIGLIPFFSSKRKRWPFPEKKRSTFPFVRTSDAYRAVPSLNRLFKLIY